MPQIRDTAGYHAASLADHGLLLAAPARGSSSSSDGTDEADGVGAALRPSSVAFHPLDAWAPHSEWAASLPAGEDAVAVALGRTFAAVATSGRAGHLLRVFTLAGVQQLLLTLEGPPVALAAEGTLLAAVWHAAPPSPGPPAEQRLEVNTLLDKVLRSDEMQQPEHRLFCHAGHCVNLFAELHLRRD